MAMRTENHIPMSGFVSRVRRAAAGLLVFGLAGLMGAAAPALAQQQPAASAVTVLTVAPMAEPIRAMVSQAGRRQSVRLVVIAGADLAERLAAEKQADLVILDDAEHLNRLVEDGTVQRGSLAPLARDRLAIAQVSERATAIRVRPGFGVLEILEDGGFGVLGAERGALGAVSRSILGTLGVLDTLGARLVSYDTLPALVQALESGAVTAALLPKSMLTSRARLESSGDVPESYHPPVIYTAALLTGRDRPATRQFLDRLRGSDGTAAMLRFGLMQVQ